MKPNHCFTRMRALVFLSALSLSTFAIAQVQTPAAALPQAPSAGESSSSSYQFLADDMNAAASEPAGAAGQYDNKGSHHHGYLHHLAFEAGGGFNGPTSGPSDSAAITWGGNFTVGGGFHLDKYVSVLAEYQFIDDKLPGFLIAESGASGGNAHIWSFTLDPVIDLIPGKHNTVYVTGGGGFYRKVTSFTDPEPAEYCTYYYCGIVYQNTVVGHFSSNQGGWNVGGGYAHKMGGQYGDGKTQIFAEARFLWVNTPAVTTEPNSLGTTTVAADTKLIPVTFGVRF